MSRKRATAAQGGRARKPCLDVQEAEIHRDVLEELEDAQLGLLRERVRLARCALVGTLCKGSMVGGNFDVRIMVVGCLWALLDWGAKARTCRMLRYAIHNTRDSG